MTSAPLALPEARSTAIDRQAREMSERFYRRALVGLEDGAFEYLENLLVLAGCCCLAVHYDFVVQALADTLKHEETMQRMFGEMFSAEVAA